MTRTLMLAAAIASLALPALAQTTTTVTTDPQTQAAPPPPSTSTTVTTQSQPPPPSTQVVVNPNDNTTSRVRVDDTTSVQTTPTGRGTAVIVATDALYGGLAGAVVGGGITLLSSGDHWQRDLMIGTGVGILAGAAFGIYEVASQNNAGTTVRRAEADPGSGNSNTAGLAFASLAGRF
jgi:hypothetical protein